MPILEKIQKQNALTAAIEGMRAYIIDNKLRPGDRLPTENELSQGLGISRNIIRESMQYFRSAGIVETKQKVGAVIRCFMPDDPFKNYMPFLAGDADCIREAAQMRMALECGSAAFMIANCKASEIAALKKLIQELTSESVRVEFDIKFHTILLRMTRNRFIESMIPLTVNFFTENTSALKGRYYCDLKRIASEHRPIVEALEAKDAAALDTALKLHYNAYLENNKKRGSGK